MFILENVEGLTLPRAGTAGETMLSHILSLDGVINLKPAGVIPSFGKNSFCKANKTYSSMIESKHWASQTGLIQPLGDD